MLKLTTRSCAAALALSAAIAAHPLQAQAPAGYHQTRVVPLPTFVYDSLANGHFILSIDRRTTSPAESLVVEIAESVFPDVSQIERAAARETLSAVVERLAFARRLPGERWWWDDFDDVLTPYAVTGASVAYYTTRIRERAAQPNPFVQFSEGRPHSGSFAYSATVTSRSAVDRGDVGYLVHLELTWRYFCGTLCAVSFRKTRDVTISRDGRVIMIQGDGRPLLIVS
jgi:hypothetical protein